MGANQGSLSQEAKRNTVSFYINGKSYTVNTECDNIGLQYRLVDFIRDNAGLKGTKTMCREGGCGACVVSVTSPGQEKIRAVNSCLIPVFSCDGWSVTTVEGLGNKKEGYHPVQQKLVNFGGSQCGMCSSGVVMNMYSLLESKKSMKSKEIENSFDGNICRCTGYRPILDGFKTFASDVSDELKQKCMDIEDIYGASCPLKKTTSDEEFVDLGGFCSQSDIDLNLQSGDKWVKATTLEKAFTALDRFKKEGRTARIVAGNSGTGVFKTDIEGCQAFIDIMSIPELSLVNIGPGNLVLGGAVTLTKAIEAFRRASNIEGFEYVKGLSKHILRIANVPVRNMGTIAGNLMLKHAHREFPSDLFTIFETVGAQLSIATSPTGLNLHTMTDFLSLNMASQIIVSVHFKPYTKQHIFRSFKISRRYQNAHAYVNAGFLMKVDVLDNFKVLERPRIVFGGINHEFVHARDTEAFLVGKFLKDSTVIKDASDRLDREVQPEVNIVDGSVQYRKLLTQSLLYKYVLGILGTSAKSDKITGGRNIPRNVTSGKQTYETDKSTWPVNKPVLKLESVPQVSGTAEYINDINSEYGELFGAFVVSTVAKADIISIDPSEAFKIPGVVRFVKASDIPGENNYMLNKGTPDEIFAKDKVKYAGQPVGLLLCTTKEIAFLAAKKVIVEYANIEKGILTIQDGIRRANEAGEYKELFKESVKCTAVSEADIKHVIKGEFEMGSQYHFQMEHQVCICIPREDGIDVLSATQDMDHVQNAVASSLKIPNNEINIQIRRLGGAYGCKITRATQIATACAIAAHITNKPVRVALDLQTNMEAIGKRPPYLMKYEMGVDDNGKILSLKAQVFCGVGISANEETAEEGISYFQSIYRAVGWELTPANIITNTAPNTWCRAPGSVPGIAMVENLMEHIAFTLKKDPVDVRMTNLLTEGDSFFGSVEHMKEANLIPRMIDELKASGEIEERKQLMANFNKENRWRKRGMAFVPMRYPLQYYGSMKFPVYIAIYKNDGSVVVSHGGIEVGQGINTKIAQTVAFEFEIPIENIKVKPSNNLISPNTDSTGASITSEICCHAAQMACKELKERMAPIKEQYKTKSWIELVKLSNLSNVHLTASHLPDLKDGLKGYNIWVVNLTEVEIDVLTGEYKIVRVDIVEDAGKSLNPLIDVGQIEGALIMGLGNWTTEKLIYDEQTGQLLTNGTWLYKPPLPKDIPEDMRITLLKNAPNPFGVLRSKATGEPPQCSAIAVLFALKNAIYEARKDAGHNEWFQLDGPVTPEDVLLKCLTSPSQFLL